MSEIAETPIKEIQTEPTPLGIFKWGSRSFQVSRITDPGYFTGLTLAGKTRAVCVLEGVRGARYLMVDNGPRHYMTAWNISTVTRGWGGRRFVSSTPWDNGGCPRAELAAMLGLDA